MVLQKLSLGEYGAIDFENHNGGLRGVIKLKNGYQASIITNFSGNDGYHGDWKEQTFEVGVLNHKGVFSCFEDINDDEYQINGGIWSRLSVEDLIEKIKIVENL